MKKLSSSAYSLILVAIAMLGVIGSSLRLLSFASKLLPLIIGSIVFLLAIIGLAREIKAGVSPEATAVSASEGGVGEKKKNTGVLEYSEISAWILGYAVSIYLVGFLIATLALVGAYMKRHGSSWFETVMTAVIFTAIIYVVFDLRSTQTCTRVNCSFGFSANVKELETSIPEREIALCTDGERDWEYWCPRGISRWSPNSV